jgi:hypothetical protein
MIGEIKGAIRSVSSSHFTGALAPAAVEHEDLSFPDQWGTAGIQSINIHNVTMTIDNTSTTTVVPFYINFFGNDLGAEATPDAEDFQGRIEIAEADFEQFGASGLFRANIDLSATPIVYIDQDNTGELHISLENSDAATTWHADDEVQITFIVSPNL